jgi:hypothetical protein
MIVRIHRDAIFQKQLKNLRQVGGLAALAADHAESIIQGITFQGIRRLSEAGRLTRHGEARLKNCIKYDLVGAYRLLAFREGEDLVFSFIGTHDECSRWIKNNSTNSSVRPLVEKRRNETCPVLASQDEVESDSALEEEADAEDDYLDRLTAILDEKDLRKIFRGLCGT